MMGTLRFLVAGILSGLGDRIVKSYDALQAGRTERKLKRKAAKAEKKEDK